METSVLDGSTKDATIIRGAGTSKIFQILYRNEEVILRDTILFRVRLPGKLINANKIPPISQNAKTDFYSRK